MEQSKQMPQTSVVGVGAQRALNRDESLGMIAALKGRRAGSQDCIGLAGGGRAPKHLRDFNCHDSLVDLLNVVVPDAGFEPATFGLQNRCSTN